MKAIIQLLMLFLGVFVAFLLQQALPPIPSAHGARFVFVPMIFCYSAMVLPFPAMLAAAFYTGLLTDLMYLHVVGGHVEIGLGWSIFYFVIFGSISNGLRSSMEEGTWWPFIILSALGTSAFLLSQFLMVTFRREGIVFDEVVLWRVLAPGAVAALCAPLLHFGVKSFGSFLPSDPLETRGY